MRLPALARSWLLPAAAVALLLPPRPCGAGTPLVTLSPPTISVSTFSPTPRLRIEGRVAAGSAVVITVRGGDAREAFNVKGRVGPIWATTGTLHVSGVPALFLSLTGAPLAEIVSRASIDEFVLDERAVIGRMRVEPAEADRPEIRDSYLRLKVDDGSYRSFPDAVATAPAVGGEQPFSAEMSWPANARPGSYSVAVYECRGGSVVGRATAPLTVVQSGAAAGLKGLADGRGGIYGMLAVGITMSLGFGLDFVLARLRRRRAGSRRKGAQAPARHDVAAH